MKMESPFFVCCCLRLCLCNTHKLKNVFFLFSFCLFLFHSSKSRNVEKFDGRFCARACLRACVCMWVRVCIDDRIYIVTVHVVYIRIHWYWCEYVPYDAVFFFLCFACHPQNCVHWKLNAYDRPICIYYKNPYINHFFHFDKSNKFNVYRRSWRFC